MTEHKYYNPRKVLIQGTKVYSGGWIEFPKRIPKTDSGNLLVGILAPSNGTKVGAVEIPDQETFEEFCEECVKTGFVYGGRVFLYALPIKMANECKSNTGTGRFKEGELARITKSA